MTKRILSVTSIWIMYLLFVYGIFNQIKAAPNSEFVSKMLTDWDVTNYQVLDPTMVIGKQSAHISWVEQIEVQSGEPPSDALFYTNLPAGDTQLLSAPTDTTYLTSFNGMVLNEADNAYLIWAEETGTDEYDDMFFWKTGMTNALNISNPALSVSEVRTGFLVLDDNNRAHVVWEERLQSNPFFHGIFYWQEGGGTIVIPGGNNVASLLDTAVSSNVIHVLWKAGSDLPGIDQDLYYWNSDRQATVNLRGGSLSETAREESSFLNEAGVYQVLWIDEASGCVCGSRYLNYWDSMSQQNQVITVTTELIAPTLRRDGAGNAYVTWQLNGATYLWDSVSQTSSLIVPSTTGIISADGQQGEHIHTAWVDSDVDWPTHLNDMFYWRTDMAEPINITDHTAAPDNPSNVELLVDETDVAHIIWEEGGFHQYYNSQTGNTTLLTGTLETADQFHLDQLITVKDGVAYIMFGDESATSETPFWIWRSDRKQYIPIPAVYGPTATNANRGIWLNSSGEIVAAWEDASLAGEGSNVHLWHESYGSQDVTLHAESDGDAEITAVGSDALGRSYIAWMEESIVDYEDMFGGYIFGSPPNAIFLPVVSRP